MKLRFVMFGVPLAIIVGCASIIDIPELQAPAAGTEDAGGDGGDGGDGGGPEASCSATNVENLTVSPRGVHTAVDATDVYFTRADPPNSAILRCSKCGCTKPTELAKLIQPGGIAVDEKYVFWTDTDENGSVSRMSKTDPTDVKTVPDQESPVGVTSDGSFVYWTVVGGIKGVATAGVWRARRDDLGQVTRLAAADTDNNIIPYGIAVDETYVYYTTASDLNDQDAMNPCLPKMTGQVRRVLKHGSAMQTPTTLATGQACPLALTIDDTSIYWVNLGVKDFAGSIWRTPKSGGTAAQLVGGLGRATSLAVSGGRLAWNVPESQHVDGCKLPACSPVATLANNQLNPSGLSADATGTYWVVLGTPAQNFTDGALRRAPAPAP